MHLRQFTCVGLRLAAALTLLVAVSAAQTTWTGAVSSVWDVGGNWSAGVPDAVTSASIPAAVPNDPSTAGAASAACLDLDLDAGASLTVGAAIPLTISGDADLQGSVSGTGDIVLAGVGTLTAGALTSIPNLVVTAGGADVVTISGNVDVSSDLSLTEGVLTFATSSTMTVAGNASLSGGVLAGAATSLLDVEGDITFSGTTSTSPPDIDVAGDWSSDADVNFATGLVTFNGTTSQGVTAPDSALFDVTFDASAFIDSSGLVIPIGGEITVHASASFSILTIIQLIGASQTVDPGGDLPSVEVASPGSVNMRDGVTLDGSLSIIYGKMCIDNTAEMTVAGDASFTGGTLTGANTSAVLDIAGDVTWIGTAAVDPPGMVIGGDWSSNGSFTPNNNVVDFTGGGTRDIFADDSIFVDVRVGASTLLDVTSPRLALSGDLETPVSGGFSSPSTVGFVGTSQTVAPGGPLPNVEVDGPSVTFTAAAQVVDTLRLISGTMTVDASAEVDVTNDADFEGGDLASGGAGARLDVEGACSFTGTTTSTPPDIDCAGDWTSDATFAPLAGIVRLDGAADTSFGSFGPDFDPTFFVVRFVNGRRVVEHDLELNADTIRVAATGELDLNSNRVIIPGTIVDIEGRLDIDRSAELLLGGGVDMSVTQTGELSMIGVDTAPARIAGFNGGGYQLNIDGRVTACGFEFAEPGPMGIVISNLAEFTEAPFDMRNGTFTQPSPVLGSVLLDIERPDDTVFSRLTFNDPLSVGSFNVKASTSAPITFLNYDGRFGGPSLVHPTTPQGTINWVQGAQTQLASNFSATDGEGKTTLFWQTIFEVDVEAFLVEAGPTPAGPWTLVGETPALGSGSTYAVNHFAPAPGTTCYRLSERLFHSGDINPLAGDCTSAAADPNPPNILTVSPFGTYPTIGAALTALGGGITGPIVDIRVAAGTYPPFTVDMSALGVSVVHIGAIGNGTVTIDVSNAPVEIVNVPLASSVFLNDVSLGADIFVPGAGPALVVDSCVGMVLLDRVDIRGSAGPGMVATDAQRLLIQSAVMTDGAPDMLLDGATTAVVSKSMIDQLDATGTTNLRVCEVDGNVQASGSATLQTFVGKMPRAAPPFSFVSVAQPFDVTVDGTPGGMPVLRIDFANDWFDSPKPKWEFISNVPFPGLLELNLPPLGVNPTTLPFIIPAAFQTQLAGFSLHFQPVVLQPITGKIRFGHLSRMTFSL